MTSNIAGNRNTATRQYGRHLSSTSRLALTLAMGSAALIGGASSAMAADTTWTGATSTDWFVTSNWDTGAEPTAGDFVILNSTVPNSTVVDGANASALVVFVGRDAGGVGSLSIVNGGTLADSQGHLGRYTGSIGTALVDGAGSTWTNSDSLYVGNSGNGTLTISNSGYVTNTQGILGEGGVGTVVVNGAGSTWANSGYLHVGNFSVGMLTVSNGGTVSSALGILGNSGAASGTATVTGAGSTWTNTGDLTVGQSGSGTLNVLNGGMVSDVTGVIGAQSGSTGTAIVSGAGSSWTNSSELYVGKSGTGTLAISNGGAVSSTGGYIGFGLNSTGSATVSGAGSTWTIGSLGLGWAGKGTLTIANGGLVTANSGKIGLFAGGDGTAIVDGAGSALTFANDLDVGWSGGAGALTIQNGGTVSNQKAIVGSQPGSTGAVTVTGAGSTWTNTGNLVVGLHAAGTLSILNGGTVTSANAQVGEYAGGPGTVTVAGLGSLWTNAGDLFVGGDGDGPGTLTIADGGAVSAGGNFVIANGVGSLGSLNIGAAAGSAPAGAGALNTATVQFGAGTGALNFNHTDSAYTFAPVINGTNGTINQIAGTTILTANSAGFTGATNVTGGRLSVNGSLAGSLVTVSGGGTLGGNGAVGGIAAQSGGIIGPGNSIGTLNVAGNLTQAAGSVYQVELTSTGTSDLIHATGTATLTSGALLDVVKLDAAPYVGGTHYMVLQADGGITGTYTVTGATGSAFLGLVDSYDANHVYLDVIAKTFAQVGLTPNQIAAGAGAESLGAGNALYDAIAVLPTAAIAQAAFDQISGEIHASGRTAMVEDSRFLREAAIDRLRIAFGETVAGARNDEAGGDEQPGVWARGFGALGQWNGDGNAATMTRNTGGLFTGADGVTGDNWRLGVVGGYGHSSYGVGERNSTAESNDYHVGLYGGTEWGDLAFRSGLAYAWHDIDTTRAVAFPGFANTLTGDYGAGTTQAFGELGYRFKVEDVILEPFANFAYVNQATGGFSETGGTGALDVAPGSTNTAFTTLGLRASTSFTLDHGATVTARGMIGWRHAFGDTTPTSGMAFPGGSAFTIAGVPMAGDAALLDLGLDLSFTPSATLGLAYGGQFGAASIDQTIKGTLNVKF